MLDSDLLPNGGIWVLDFHSWHVSSKPNSEALSACAVLVRQLCWYWTQASFPDKASQFHGPLATMCLFL